jgi:hypothetical protein
MQEEVCGYLPQPEVTICDFGFSNSFVDNWNMKPAGNFSVFLLTAWFNTFVSTGISLRDENQALLSGLCWCSLPILNEESFFIDEKHQQRRKCKNPTSLNPLQPTHLVSSAGGTN